MWREASLFEQLLAESFQDLPIELRRVHDRRPTKRFSGLCSVERGKGIVARLIAPLASLPPTSTGAALAVDIEATPDAEFWLRDFSGHAMASHFRRHQGLLQEKLGLVTLRFALKVVNHGIEWRVVHASCLGIPLPRGWFAHSIATERLINGHYSFDVRASLPLAGLLIHYWGSLSELE